MDHNAWSPAGPGKHGYMQVGLGRDKRLFNDAGDYRHVFVGAGKHFLYCGWYHVLRVEPLTKEEWETLPPKVKQTYSETTVSKEKSAELKSVQQVLRMYNEGVLRAPCVRLQCVEFDTAFYQELARANDQFFQHRPLQMRPSAHKGGAGPSKRRRVDKESTHTLVDDSEEEVSLALVTKKKTLVATPSSTPAFSSTSQLKVDDTVDTKVDLTTSELPPSVPPVDVNVTPGAGPSTMRTAPSTGSSTVPMQSGSIKLRIPPRRSVNGKPLIPDVLEDVIELSDLSSESDDDDMYAN
ncbi:uncharacterized protein TRAVEDRAFT_158665 [Trametes versicolor FP-101664 SS1]|uniref:uncharacterized protein n=1 Tax=Trametes versicolor (strain FP-101664) TaxID=717944 RepID=UPI0004623BE2|nr:uncharacterized protein TRAVEDRAFT_158665 [Trametes versicolor FP-101664 SS1]EIW64423.1 hypothetical protein TRAVEDRAFT_158665 [Trametes versicolor FP-101664 SS1]